MTVAAPPPPQTRLALGITGHRDGNPALHANRAAVEAAMATLFDRIDALVKSQPGAARIAPTRLHSLLSGGVDMIAAEAATERGWELVAPLPFSPALNCAINAMPTTLADASALRAGGAAADPAVEARAAIIREWTARAHVFALADREREIAAFQDEALANPADLGIAQSFAAHCSDQAALAGRVMIEQSDFLIAVWDRKSRNLTGGTGHTIAMALEAGSLVLLLDPVDPANWRILHASESLAALELPPLLDEAQLAALVRQVFQPEDESGMIEASERLEREHWRANSSRMFSAYRRIEAMFGGGPRPFRSLRQHYETPQRIAAGSGAPLLAAAAAVPGRDPVLVDAIATALLPRFAWADGIGAWYSDAYRSGMIANFAFSALAVMSGLAYQPLEADGEKWMFALSEFLLLALILLITWLGGRWQWHARWFETRRVSEYLRHAPIMAMLGVARAPWRWPRGGDTNWPEYHARACLRSVGLPRAEITPTYLRAALVTIIEPHAVGQRDYHRAKALRLKTVHHRLDLVSERLFIGAVIASGSYLMLALADRMGWIGHEVLHSVSHLFTFVGVSLPMLGASIAGIRFFGDFERFASISEITAEKLDGVTARLRLLLAAGSYPIDYGAVSDLVHRIDEIVVSEIESWQAVFGGKHLSLPG